MPNKASERFGNGKKKKKKVKKHCSNLSSKVEVQPFPLTFHSPDETNLQVFIRLGGDRMNVLGKC